MENKEILENTEDMDIKKSDPVKYLMDIGLKEVSSKTFIHQDELTRFLSGNFDNINQTKAMGFIQILQREYKIDLSDLKQKYLSYKQENPSTNPKAKESLIMEEVKSEERTKSFFSIIFLLLSVGAIAYLINKYDLLNFDKPMDIPTASIEDKNSKNKTETVNLNKIASDDTKKEVKKTQEIKEEVKQEPKQEVKQETKNELDLNKVLEETKKENTQANTENKQANSPTNNLENKNGLDLSKLNTDLANTDTVQETTSQAATTDEQNSSNTQSITNELYIVPDSKVWVGTIDLNTYKKHDFLTPRGKKIDIDTSKNQLIMIGHRFVKMYLNGERVKFKRKGPIRFKYIDGELTEINRREFNKLAKGRQW